MSVTTEDVIIKGLKGGASALEAIRGILGAAQRMLEIEGEGRWKMVTLIGGRDDSEMVQVLPLCTTEGAASFKPSVISAAREGLIRCLLDCADATVVPHTESEEDDQSDFEGDGEDEIRELWEEEAGDNPEVLAGLSEMSLLCPLEAEEEDNIDQDFDFMDDISDDTPESDEAFGNPVPIDDDARIDPNTDEDNGDVFWGVVEENKEEDASESEVVSELGFEHLAKPSPEHYTIMWGSDDAAFPTSGGEPFNTVDDLHATMSRMYLSHPTSTCAKTLSMATEPPLERPPLLRQYQLAYNRINGFITCENPGKVDGVCCSGLPINQIFKHLTEKAIRESSDCLPHGYKIKPTEKSSLEETILQRYPTAPITPQDLQKIRPLPGQVGPIVGAPPPTPGYICKECHRGYTTSGSARSHWKDKHRNTRKPQEGSVLTSCFLPVPQMQSLSLHKNFICYFAITPDPTEANRIAPLATSDDIALLNALQEEVFGSDEQDVEELDLEEVQEFFRNSGATSYVEGLDPSQLLQLVGLPRADEQLLVKLRRAQSLRFESQSRRISRGNAAVRRLIVTTIHGEGQRKKFKAPRKKSSRMRYSLEELRLLCFVVRCFDSGLYSTFTTEGSSDSESSESESDGSTTLPTKRGIPHRKGGAYCITLTTTQIAAIEALKAHLAHSNYNSKELFRAINGLAEALYMPDNTLGMVEDVFLSPVAAMMCLRALASGGGFLPPKSITGNLIGIQYAIRLCLFSAVMRRWRQTKNEGANAGDWFRPLAEMISRWALQTEVSPLASIREWISELSGFVFNTAPVDIISWPSPRVMLLKDLRIDINQFISKVQQSLQDLRVHVREKVLFGIHTSFRLPTTDTQDQRTRGYSAFGPPEESLKNVDSAAFLSALLKAGKLGHRTQDGRIVWNRQKVDQWLADIDRSWSDVYRQLHILSLSGRGTEEILSQWANSAEGRRHLFVVNLIMALISNYHKGHQTTGLYKQILRLMPNELGYVIAILLRVVRPIEATVAAKFYAPVGQKEKMKRLYGKRLFVSFGRAWDSTKLSALLKGWWKENMGLPIAMNLHRQFTVGMQRQFVRYPEDDPKKSAAQEAFAHGKRADELYYAKKHGDSNIPLSRQTLFEAICKDWLAVFGFKDPRAYRESLWDDSDIFSQE